MITQSQRDQYWLLRRKGFSITRACMEAGFSRMSAHRMEQTVTAQKSPHASRPGGKHGPRAKAVVAHPPPLHRDELAPEALRALDDFGYFQRRYMGRIATPWQEEAAYTVVEKLVSPDKEFLVINAPPGSGKSTTFTLDIPAWITVRDRAIRGMIGSASEHGAVRYVQRLRRLLEAVHPQQSEPEDIAKGLAIDAVATLAGDFGRFQPYGHETWAQGAFVVEQIDGVPITEKELTWNAWGRDSLFLGMRLDFIVWDDLVDLRNIGTADARDKLFEWWDSQAEKRLEPSGLLILQGQRLGPDDLYRYCLDKTVVPEGDDDQNLDQRKYHHVIFKAHYDDRCERDHGLDAAYYPDGCLLDPRRLTYKDLRSEMSNPRGNYAVIYQQEDMDASETLVNPLWIKGGIDPKTGINYPGCIDRDRDICQLPGGLAGTLFSYACVDPSPTKWWAITWWVTRIDENSVPQERYLMDVFRAKMDAPNFLEFQTATKSYIGLAEEWQQRSKDLGWPIRYWIVEANVAQRWILQYEMARVWARVNEIDWIPHQTSRYTKADDTYGIEAMADIYKQGLVRLPWKGHAHGGRGWIASQKLVEEVIHWTPARQFKTDDVLMSQWFGEWNLPRLMPTPASLPLLRRPSWLQGINTWDQSWRKLAHA